jgi:hypothetical protein
LQANNASAGHCRIRWKVKQRLGGGLAPNAVLYLRQSSNETAV